MKNIMRIDSENLLFAQIYWHFVNCIICLRGILLNRRICSHVIDEKQSTVLKCDIIVDGNLFE